MDELITAARDVQDRAHVPFPTGSGRCPLDGRRGEIFVGCNLENANFSNSLHAEEGRDRGSGQERPSGVRPAGREFGPPRRRHAPCGMCRQTLTEFCDDDLVVYCDEGEGRSRPSTRSANCCRTRSVRKRSSSADLFVAQYCRSNASGPETV